MQDKTKKGIIKVAYLVSESNRTRAASKIDEGSK